MYEQYRGSAKQKSKENTKLTLKTDRTTTEQTDMYVQYRGFASRKSRENTRSTLQTDHTATEQAEVKAIHYSPESRALYYVIAEIFSFN
ncbi:5356_t:CDS:2 [Paraglomus brasilianum]|uniref:5356_t:CDS:1 n=1 Tax=Paraglomus brasilianum TaxID=144538 RepID=A0A9N8VPV8_9GLOM|nr:5356_t:CDS:2 [Paraglomus brasilianum]